MSDGFVVETPVAKKRESISGLDDSQGRLSNGSFMSASLNHENFGDWGSFNNSKDVSLPFPIDEGETDDPFSAQKEGGNMDGFDLTERKDVPKLPMSRREIRKVNMHEQNQPTVIIQTGSGHLNGESDFLVSPIDFKSPVTASKNSSNKLRSEPTRSIQRSVSDVGSIDKKETSQAEESNPPSPGFRNLWKTQKGNEMSLSFRNRRQPFSKRPLLNQIGERRQSYRHLDQEEGVEEEDEDKPQATPQIGHRNGNENFEGTMPLKAMASPSNEVIKKRSSSKDRLKNKGAARTNSTGMRAEDPNLDEYGQRRPTRKSSHRSRSSGSSGRRRTRNASLSDSNRSTNRNSRRKNDATDYNNDTTIPMSSDSDRDSMLAEVRRRRSSRNRKSRQNNDSTDSNNDTTIPMSSDSDRDSLLAEVQHRRSSRRLSEKGHRVRSRSRNNIKPKKSTGRRTNGSSEEVPKHSSRCNTRRIAGRRASMTGGIVDTEPDKPRSRRRSSMDHFKIESPVGRPNDARRRRASMDHYAVSSPSSNCSPIENPKTKSNRSIALSSHVGDEGSPFPSRSPFGEEGTVTTKEISEGSLSFRNTKNDQIRPLSRKSSIASRTPPRKTSSNPNPSKESSHGSRRNTARTRSDLGRQRHRHQKEDKDKSVTVGEIFALLASTPNREEISGEGAPRPLPRTARSRSSDPIKRNSGNTFSSTISPHSFRDKRLDRSSQRGTPRGKSRSRSRLVQRTPQEQHHRSSSLYKIRKSKRVGHQPEESFSQEESPIKKEKPLVLGKESRRSYRNRRASAI